MDKNGKTTIRDIADACGVTIATISRAINHQSGLREELRNHILQYIETVGWSANSLKNRFLLSGNADKNVLILCNSWTLNGGGKDTLQETLSLLVSRLEGDGIIPMVVFGQNLPVLERCIEHPPYAVVLLTGSPLFFDALQELRKRGVRVCAGYANLECSQVCACVRTDYEQGVVDALALLRKAGCSRPGVFAGLSAAEHPVDPEHISDLPTRLIVRKLVEMLPDFDPKRDVLGDCFGHPQKLRTLLAEQTYDGWIISGNAIAQCFLTEAEKLKLRVPEKLPVVLFGSEPNQFDPLTRLCRFTSRADEIAEALYAKVMGPQFPEPEEILLPCRRRDGSVPLGRRRRRGTSDQEGAK
ncbi:MAG: LacI family DNA-binding transcriptional regulator [Victivallaceae bacterium]|nr:LacI family DNA-binding transcriptional regulator [Victivallaceae bacterium]